MADRADAETADGQGGEAVRLKGFIRALPQRERLVFLLRYADDLSAMDIGAVTGMPAHVVAAILSRIERQARSVIAAPAPAIFG